MFRSIAAFMQSRDCFHVQQDLLKGQIIMSLLSEIGTFLTKSSEAHIAFKDLINDLTEKIAVPLKIHGSYCTGIKEHISNVQSLIDTGFQIAKADIPSNSYVLKSENKFGKLVVETSYPPEPGKTKINYSSGNPFATDPGQKGEVRFSHNPTGGSVTWRNGSELVPQERIEMTYPPVPVPGQHRELPVDVYYEEEFRPSEKYGIAHSTVTYLNSLEPEIATQILNHGDNFQTLKDSRRLGNDLGQLTFDPESRQMKYESLNPYEPKVIFTKTQRGENIQNSVVQVTKPGATTPVVEVNQNSGTSARFYYRKPGSGSIRV